MYLTHLLWLHHTPFAIDHVHFRLRMQSLLKYMHYESLIFVASRGFLAGVLVCYDVIPEMQYCKLLTDRYRSR